MDSTKPRKITLCGSTKFKSAFIEWNTRLTIGGNIVYSVSCFGHADEIIFTSVEKEALDRAHFLKIDHSDEIFVLDVGEYVGESTRNEIHYAAKAGKKITYLSVECPGWTENDCIYFRDNNAAAYKKLQNELLEERTKYHNVLTRIDTEKSNLIKERDLLEKQCNTLSNEVLEMASKIRKLYV